MTDETDRDDDIAFAGEFVLRLLSPREEAAAAGRMDADPAFRRLVTEWEESLATLADEVPETPPPARMKADLEARLFPTRNRRALLPWLGGLVAAAALILVLAFLPGGLDDPEYRTRIVSDDQTSLIVTASIDVDSGTMLLSREAGGPLPGRVLQLWMRPVGEENVTSLGVLPDAETGEIVVPPELRERMEGAAFGISDEPPGGSPTGQPTGEVIGHGDAIPI